MVQRDVNRKGVSHTQRKNHEDPEHPAEKIGKAEDFTSEEDERTTIASYNHWISELMPNTISKSYVSYKTGKRSSLTK